MTRVALACLILTLAGCGEGPRTIAVEVRIPEPNGIDAPVPNLGLVALPYDRDSILRSLEAKAPPRPNTAELDKLFQAFREPFTQFSAARYGLTAVQDTLAALKARLDALPRTDSSYEAQYRRFARLNDSASVLARRVAQLRPALDAARRAFVGPSDSLRAIIRAWEDSTYRGYDTIVSDLARQLGREPIADTTGADGRARLRLPAGRWWLYARSWDATDPNAEWYWNVPVSADVMLLDRRNGQRRPKY